LEALRQSLAIATELLDSSEIESLASASRSTLRDPWCAAKERSAAALLDNWSQDLSLPLLATIKDELTKQMLTDFVMLLRAAILATVRYAENSHPWRLSRRDHA
jgi:hypothetical protein